jgi:hypothetical protein
MVHLSLYLSILFSRGKQNEAKQRDAAAQNRRATLGIGF